MIEKLSDSGHKRVITDSTVTPSLFPSLSETPGHRDLQ